MLNWVCDNILGGRPMKFLIRGFTDDISGEPVDFYLDTLGRVWMANNEWGTFRVATDYSIDDVMEVWQPRSC